jgi:DNA-binding NarL/FixJ family response regulator
MDSIKIGIIDDHQIVRQGLKELLHKINNYQVVYEFDNGEDFLEALPLASPPDIYILDYSMPNMTGIEVLMELEKVSAHEEYKVLLLTQHFDEYIIDAAYGYGARGFLNKNCTAQELKFAIESIVTTGYTNVTDILKRVKKFEKITLERKEANIVLSDKELEFLKLVCDERELTYEQMSEIMGMSLKSIDFYRSTLFERFDIRSKIGLVLFSFKYRLTEPFI